MEGINRINVVIVEEKRTNKWLAKQLRAIHQPFQNGVPIRCNSI